MTSRRESRSSFLSAFRTRLGWIAASTPSSLRRRRRAGQFFHEVQGQGVLDELFALRADVEAVPLLKAHGPDDAGGILHEAQGVDDADRLALDVALAAEEVDEAAELPLVEAEGHCVDGEVAAEQIHFDGRELHGGQGGGVFIVFEARRGHVEALFLAVLVMIDDEGRHEGPVLADAASKFLRQRPGKGDAVAFDHQIDVVELHGGAAEHDVADKTAPGIDGHRVPRPCGACAAWAAGAGWTAVSPDSVRVRWC